MKVLPLGGGQDVGRSCVLVVLGGRKIMFDCGMHMGFTCADARWLSQVLTRIVCRGCAATPVGSQTSAPRGMLTSSVSRTSISTTSARCQCSLRWPGVLRGVGRARELSAARSYMGPVVMTHPTRALVPLMLEDFRSAIVL